MKLLVTGLSFVGLVLLGTYVVRLLNGSTEDFFVGLVLSVVAVVLSRWVVLKTWFSQKG